MLNRMRLLLVLLSGAGWILVACGKQASLPASTNQDIFATYGAFNRLPSTEEEALTQGWVDSGECVPQMGRHFIKMDGGQPSPLVLLFNPAGDLIGVELESLSEQPSPPWEHLEHGHPGMEFEHWTIHFWLTDPSDVCAG